MIKNQINQILNYIKVNPQKRYEHISKLITKRHPMTNYLTKILMSDSTNLVINRVNDGKSNLVSGRLDFYDKISVLKNLMKKTDK